MPTDNPLKAFYRKSKFRISLPSVGKWYPTGSLTLDASKSVEVFAMNADDDIRFKAGEMSLSGKSTLDLIKSCIPAIQQPELIPSIDIDSILLAIRAASYGDNFTTTISVPKTRLVRKLDLKISELLNTIPSDPENWDENLKITNDDGVVMNITMRPIQLQELFKLTKFIITKQRQLQTAINSGDLESEKLDENIHDITKSAIGMICSSIQNISIMDQAQQVLAAYNAETDDRQIVHDLLSNMDVAYFNTIKNHLDQQKKKYTITTGPIEATQDEIDAGADKLWMADVIFGGSDFFRV